MGFKHVNYILYLFATMFLSACGGSKDSSVDNSGRSLNENIGRFKKTAVNNSAISVNVGLNQISDPNLLVPISGSSTTNSTEGTVQYEWTQINGPTAYILNPRQPETLVLVPDMQEPAVLHFRLAGTLLKSGADPITDSDTLSVIVSPLSGPLRVVGEIKSETDSALEFTISLDEPATQAFTLSYQTENRTAQDGEDYLGISGFLAFEPGETQKTITVTLLNDTLDDGDEHFALAVLAQDADIAPAWGFGVIEDDEAPGRRRFSRLPALIANPEPSELTGEAGIVQANLTWESNNDDIDLIVIDPCGNEISYGQRTQVCQGYTGQLEADNADPGVNLATENIYWANQAPFGEYTVVLSHFSGATAAYDVNVIWGNESALLRGEITAGERLEVFRFSYGAAPTVSPSAAPNPTPSSNLSSTPAASPAPVPTPLATTTPEVAPLFNTWQNQEVISSTEVGSFFNPRVSVGESGNALAVWNLFVTQEGNSIWYSYYDAESLSWSPPTRLTNNQLGIEEEDPQIAYDPNRDVFSLVWIQNTPQANNLYESSVWWSDFSAATSTWRPPQRISESFITEFKSARLPEIVADQMGNLLVAWNQSDDQPDSVLGVWANNYSALEGWGTPRRINPNTPLGLAGFYQPRLAIDGNQRVWCVWAHSDDLGTHIWRAQFDMATTEWTQAEQLQSLVYQYSTPEIASTQSGHTMVIWSDRDRNMMGKHYDPESGWSELMNIESNTDLKFSLAAYGDDNFVASYFSNDFIEDTQNLTTNRFASSLGWQPAEIVFVAPGDASILTTQIRINSQGNGFLVWNAPRDLQTSHQLLSNSFNPGLSWYQEEQLSNADIFTFATHINQNGDGISIWLQNRSVFAMHYLPSLPQ